LERSTIMAEETRQYGSCLVTIRENYAIVTFNRPDKLNAFSPDLFEGVQKAYADFKNDNALRAVIFTGAGDHFSAGGDVALDIDPLRNLALHEFKAYFEPLIELYMGLYSLDKVTIAAINGFVLGAGFEMTLLCDFRIAADTARLGEFFVRMGLVPEIGMCLLPRIVGPGMARYLCYTGELIDAQEAFRIGLVEKVVPAGELLPEAEKLAHRMARGPASIGIIKRAMNQIGGQPIELSTDVAVSYQFAATRTGDHAEAVRAFLEKRKPSFTGR
jgi:enoyl-CoA hydratase/carnithine racemase